MAFLGALILLGIYSVRNNRKAWSHQKAQLLIYLHDLISCQRFELIGTFLHAVTPEEEEEMKGDRLRKLLPVCEGKMFGSVPTSYGAECRWKNGEVQSTLPHGTVYEE